MRRLGWLICMFASSVAVAQDASNPMLEIVSPSENSLFRGRFVVETKNIDYKPELATSARDEFAIGVDAEGNELVVGEGHLHGWVFRVDWRGNLIRNDGPVPAPSDYFRFYGAGGAEFSGDKEQGYYVKTDDLPFGRYRVFFQFQQNDHTAGKTTSAPAFPAIACRDFWVLF